MSLPLPLAITPAYKGHLWKRIAYEVVVEVLF